MQATKFGSKGPEDGEAAAAVEGAGRAANGSLVTAPSPEEARMGCCAAYGDADDCGEAAAGDVPSPDQPLSGVLVVGGADMLGWDACSGGCA